MYVLVCSIFASARRRRLWDYEKKFFSFWCSYVETIGSCCCFHAFLLVNDGISGTLVCMHLQNPHQNAIAMQTLALSVYGGIYIRIR
ncbi:hypothetical protein EJ04DRAFT_116294 [Polyplosphaeria fusca]|uniref:Uncharacterized protein n=1 Tax=Polyplosphaeria fusca TaxID=682080 RepID=A0A9P4R8G7_9PLEO|nr:hypothetical protein EJ04DRAFT_116294 [Polyplosphaeria fusca]